MTLEGKTLVECGICGRWHEARALLLEGCPYGVLATAAAAPPLRRSWCTECRRETASNGGEPVIEVDDGGVERRYLECAECGSRKYQTGGEAKRSPFSPRLPTGAVATRVGVALSSPDASAAVSVG